MQRYTIFIFGLVFLLAGCNLGETVDDVTDSISTVVEQDTGAESAVTEAAPATATSEPSATVPPSATPPPTSTATPPPTLTPSATPCQVRTDWITHRVQAGDTISSLASRTGSSVNELMLANCKTDTIIFVGEQFRVPRVPAVTDTPPPTNTPTITPVPEAVINVSCSSQNQNGFLAYTMFVSWQNAGERGLTYEVQFATGRVIEFGSLFGANGSQGILLTDPVYSSNLVIIESDNTETFFNIRALCGL